MIRQLPIFLGLVFTASAVGLWAQISIVPPGTNNTQRMETAPGTAAPTAPATAPPVSPGEAIPGPPAAPIPGTSAPASGRTQSGQNAPRFPPSPPPGVPAVPKSDATNPSPPQAAGTPKEAAVKAAHFAVAPSRIEFAPGGNNKARVQTITAWSDDRSLAYSTTTSHPWLKVAATGKRNGGAQKFTVTVEETALPAGKHEGTVEIASPGSANTAIRIPVIVTVKEGPSKPNGTAAKP